MNVVCAESTKDMTPFDANEITWEPIGTYVVPSTHTEKENTADIQWNMEMNYETPRYSSCVNDTSLMESAAAFHAIHEAYELRVKECGNELKDAISIAKAQHDAAVENAKRTRDDAIETNAEKYAPYLARVKDIKETHAELVRLTKDMRDLHSTHGVLSKEFTKSGMGANICTNIFKLLTELYKKGHLYVEALQKYMYDAKLWNMRDVDIKEINNAIREYEKTSEEVCEPNRQVYAKYMS